MPPKLPLLLFVLPASALAAEPTFKHHLIDTTLPISPAGSGNYGQTAVADLDADGRPDFVLGRQAAPKDAVLYWYRFETPDKWTRHVVGDGSRSDVGLAPLDVDGDGHVDLVTSGAWYKNPGNPREKPFTRIVYDDKNVRAHDILAIDVDKDGRKDIITLRGPERNYTAEDGLVWYKIPKDPTQPWTKTLIGPGVHGAITPAGHGDIAGNGHVDLVVANKWYENRKGDGSEWVAHPFPFGRSGPYGFCTRTAVLDMDGDGKPEVVVLDADISNSTAAVFKNADGKGGQWEKFDLPQSFPYGSTHSLAVADFTGDGRPDIATNEQEELLPKGRTNPRWIVWENLGDLKFREHVILDARLGGHELQSADFDGDGKPDLISKPWSARPDNGAAGKFHVDYLRNTTAR